MRARPAEHAESAGPAGSAWPLTVRAVTAPRTAFAALRDDSPEAAAERAEPVLAIVLLAGISSVLATSTAGHLMDDPNYDALLVAVWTFLGGALYGAAAYWLLGASLWAGLRVLGSRGSYRRARHVLAFAAVPVALSLVLLPPKLALFGADLFHRGGDDTGAGGAVFATLGLGFLAWAAGLLLVGAASVERWAWGRTAAAVAIAVALPVSAWLALSSA